MSADEEPRRLTLAPPPAPKVTPGFCGTGNPWCQKPARLFAAGWRCPDHVPNRPKFDDEAA